MVDVSKWIGTPRMNPDDVPDEGLSRTIRRVDFEPGHKPFVLYFHGTRLGLPLSPSNLQRMGVAFGYETDDWEGQRVVLRRAVLTDDERGIRQPWVHVTAEGKPEP